MYLSLAALVLILDCLAAPAIAATFCNSPTKGCHVCNGQLICAGPPSGDGGPIVMMKPESNVNRDLSKGKGAGKLIDFYKSLKAPKVNRFQRF